mgnify:CR=1 FL=1
MEKERKLIATDNLQDLITELSSKPPAALATALLVTTAEVLNKQNDDDRFSEEELYKALSEAAIEALRLVKTLHFIHTIKPTKEAIH